MRDLYFDLWPGDDIKGTATGELTQSYDRKYRKVHLGVDLGTFTINIEDSQWAWLNGDVEPLIRVRRVAGGPFAYDDARYKGAFFAEIAEVTTLAVAEEVDTVARVSGRGLEAILHRAVINEVANHPDDVGDIYTQTVPIDGMWHIDGEVVEAGTHGAVMRIFLRNAEYQTPEPMPELTHDFTTIHDSNSNAWDFTDAKWSYPVGMELGDVLAELVQSGMHYDLTPDVVLHAYKDSQAVDRSGSVTIAAGKSTDKGNVSGPAGFSLVRGPGKSRVLVEGDREGDGTKVFQWVADTGIEADIGVRQGGAQYEATPTTGVLTAFGEKYLADRDLLYSGIPAIPYVETDGNEALLDYDVGDILALDIPGLPATAPVKAVTIVQLENGDADPVIEFEDIAWNAERQDGRQPIGRDPGGTAPPPLPPWEPGSAPNCSTASYDEDVPAGSGIGGHWFWTGDAKDICAGGAIRITGTFELVSGMAYPWIEGGGLRMTTVVDYTFPSASPTPNWVLGDTTPGGTVSYDLVSAYSDVLVMWTLVDYATGLGGVNNWQLAAFDEPEFGTSGQFRLWRNGQWAPDAEAIYDVTWLDPATGSPPYTGSPILYQTTHEVVPGGAASSTLTTNYPYVPSSVVVTVGGLGVTPTLTDPDAGEFTLPVDTTGGEVLVTYQVASATGTGAGNTTGGGAGGTPLPAGLDDLADVNAPTPADGDVVTWDDGAGEWIAAAPAGAVDYGEDGDISTLAYDDVPDAGVLDEAARADHVHGMPSAGGGGGGDPLASAWVENATEYTKTSTSYADLDATFAHTITTGARRVLVEFHTAVSLSGLGHLIHFTIAIDGTDVGGADGLWIAGPEFSSGKWASGFSYLTDALSAGSHTIKVRYKLGQSGTAWIGGAGTGTKSGKTTFAVQEVSDTTGPAGSAGVQVPGYLGSWYTVGLNTTNPPLTIAALPDGSRIVVGMNLVGRNATTLSCTNVTFTKMADEQNGAGSRYEVWVGVVAGGASGTTLTVNTGSSNYASVVAIGISDALTPTAGTETSGQAVGQMTPPRVDTPGTFVATLVGADNTSTAVLLAPFMPCVMVIGLGTGSGTTMMLYYAPDGSAGAACWQASSGIFTLSVDIS